MTREMQAKSPGGMQYFTQAETDNEVFVCHTWPLHQHTPNTQRVDVGSVTSSQELHELLAEVFHFPDYYGKNWDAFDECIRDIELPLHIEIIGLETLRERLPREADLFQRCIADFVKVGGHDIKFKTA